MTRLFNITVSPFILFSFLRSIDGVSFKEFGYVIILFRLFMLFINIKVFVPSVVSPLITSYYRHVIWTSRESGPFPSRNTSLTVHLKFVSLHRPGRVGIRSLWCVWILPVTNEKKPTKTTRLHTCVNSRSKGYGLVE